MASEISPDVAPWLQGLDDSDTAWGEIPNPAITSLKHGSPVSRDGSVIRTTASRIPRRSLSGLHSSLAGRQSTSQMSTQKRRNPLATMNNSEYNTLRRPQDTTKRSIGTRSVSEGSDGSVIRYSTVQRPSKSNSPAKDDASEWKRRLLKGQVPFGDQTELFGPSGLDNVFSKPRADENKKGMSKHNMSWLDRSELTPMPSSPPPWPAAPSPPTSGIRRSNRKDHIQYSSKNRTTSRRVPTQSPQLASSENYPTQSPEVTLESPRSSAHTDGSRLTHRAPGTCEDVTHDNVGANRTIGGQTELEQEDFSPVFISKHTTVNGQVDYKALDSHTMKQLQGAGSSVSRPPQTAREVPAAASCDNVDNEGEISAFTDGPSSDLSTPAPDLSLSENLPTGTPPSLVPLDDNVEVQRGGYSRVGSFQQRALSPSQPATETSAISPHPKLLSPLSTSLLEVPQATASRPLPTTPAREAVEMQPKSRSSGSPLKLFGPHDTFTNNRLLRRMSQLDPDLSVANSDTSEHHESQMPVLEKAKETVRQSSTASFGNGDLDRHSFDAEITGVTASEPEDGRSDLSPGSDIPAPGSKMPLSFRLDTSPKTRDTFKMKRKSSQRGKVQWKDPSPEPTRIHETRIVETIPESANVTQTRPVAERSQTSEPVFFGSAKRPPTTPRKDSTPKRRRTLHFSEIVEDGDLEATMSYHKQLEEVTNSRKRKDLRKGSEVIIADVETLAHRKMLRPRNPTPSERRKQRIEAEIRETTEEFVSQEPGRLEAVMEQIESSMASGSPPSMQQQARVVANEVAKFSLRVQKASGDQTQRKRSVTTQDFFNEAVMVMKLIREKAGRHSALGSVAESDQEALRRSQGTAEFDADLSSLRLSRPPSREGGSGWRPRSAQQTDARVISHLRKFQERDDTDFIADSISALDVNDDEQSVVVAVDEKANIRISAPRSSNRPSSRSGINSVPNTQSSAKDAFQTQETHNSAGTSTGRTLHTASTRKSENVGTLAPNAVAHLIGDHVGGMIYDKENQAWVRVRGSPQRRAYGSFLEPLSNITSDDDPFREISDLPVDELKEAEIRKASYNQQTLLEQDISAVGYESESPQPSDDSEAFQTTHAQLKPAPSPTRERNAPPVEFTRSAPSRLRASQNNAFDIDERLHMSEKAISRTFEGLQRPTNLGLVTTQATTERDSSLLGRQLDHELDRQQRDTSSLSCTLPEDTVITKPVDIDSVQQDLTGLSMNETDDNQNISDPQMLPDTTYSPPGSNIKTVRYLASPDLRQTIWNPSLPPSPVYHSSPHQISLRRKTTKDKANTDALEQSQLSFVATLPGKRTMSVSLSVLRPIDSTPPTGKVIHSLSPSKFEPSFLLSDLPDFTIHEEDHERPSERALAQRLAQYAAAEVDDRYAYAVKDIVRTLTDVQEDGPDWEDVRQLNLHRRSLSSLHGLDDFCARIEDINVSGNALTHLSGAPSSIRQLLGCSNQLSSLTSWSHLMNLQYLDISGNQLDDLAGLGCLVHLRELRADDNKITSLQGVQQLDGLLKLQVRRNRISGINLEHSKLYRLEEIDISGNQVRSVQCLESLPKLKNLRLDQNPLRCAPVVYSTMPQLRQLSLQDCTLETLDVSNFPSLRSLCIDGNRLATVQGIGLAEHLELLSMRRQTLPAPLRLSILSEPIEARTLRLSANALPTLALSRDFLSVQHLELASCGLHSLPDDFGLRMPNLRSLNLNFNALQDVRPLLNVHGLERLSVCGNRLSRLRKSIATFARFPALSELDCRENYLTQGFHAPHTSFVGQTLSSTIALRRSDSRDFRFLEVEEDEATRREVEEEAKYRLPAVDVEAQRQYLARLDEGLRLRRRVYQMLLAESCARLDTVDGVGFDRADVRVKDATWDRLVALGIVKKSSKATDARTAEDREEVASR